ncbi:MAG: gliding motility-associated C-terminal domain-containing protein [Lewinellaceae bacterium]|nr:gliding motility-associated C-terminal domain-containing protein [Phaeodactylibacter sp.]MCB0615945.1 gliding motility-associated C-terminal domain-containing protein [Phaeodactylibacter sp.]MCB9346580.1 gliding motility-associated C-terminal domain-containing protein [Lewinellaceae bacterium]
MARFLSIFLLGISTALQGQFILNGEAVQTDNSCYRLTNPANWSSGSIWNPDKVSLDESFEVVMDIYLGCKDQDGADGIVFGFQPVSTSIGSAGGGIGFQGITPSLGIEFDTWQNVNLTDPEYDHIAVIKNGNLDHASAGTLEGPIQASASNPNIEDCSFHSLRVSWNAPGNLLTVYFDCEIRLSLNVDMVNDIFGGDPEVFWGFTSATGAANNLHQVCFNYTSFLDQMPDVVMCPGGQVQLRATGGSSYSWTPAEGLSNPRVANPLASPVQTTAYTVEMRDVCGIPFYDDVIVEVAGDSVFFDLGPDTSICEGQSLRLDASSSNSTYEWNTGQTGAQVLASQAGRYAVTVTKTDTFCIAEDVVQVGLIPLPKVNLGQDTLLCEGQSLLLRSTFGGGEVRWQDGSAADTFRVQRSGRYELTVSNECATVSDAIQVDIESCSEVYLPNAFSPNDDGRNDRFFLYDGGDVSLIKTLAIFDRWGNQLFLRTNILPNDYQNGWDGTFKGRPVNSGVYVFFAEIVFRDGHSEVRSGDVSLLR